MTARADAPLRLEPRLLGRRLRRDGLRALPVRLVVGTSVSPETLTPNNLNGLSSHALEAAPRARTPDELLEIGFRSFERRGFTVHQRVAPATRL
jgi:hypothetical protein